MASGQTSSDAVQRPVIGRNGTSGHPFACGGCAVEPACYGIDDGETQRWLCTRCHVAETQRSSESAQTK